MKTRCGLVSSSRPIAGFAGSSTERPQWLRSCATKLWSSIRTHRSACSAPRPRSNRIDPRCSGCKASRSTSSAVNTVRRFIAQSPAGRQSATRWLQLDLVMHSNANGRQSFDSSMAMPPRVVTAPAPVADCVRRTFSSRSRENSAMPPKVPRLHWVSGSAICWCSKSIAALCVAIDRYSPGVQPGEYRLAWP